jgi:hypothetical protein
MDIERWVSVIGYEGFYEVSNFGRIRSLDRISFSNKRSNQLIRGKILLPRVNKHRQNRYTVCLWKNGKVKYDYVSRVVLEAFIGKPLPGQESAHCDGDPTNNCLDNLRWTYHIDNLADKKIHKTDPIGSRNGFSKLTENEIIKIKKLYKKTSYHNSNVKELMETFNVSRGSILNIVSGKSWKHCS